MKRFEDWLTNKGKAAVEANTKYVKILDIKDAANSIAAKARIAQINQQLADELYTAEIPKDVRSGEYAEDKIDAYCSALEEKALPLTDRSVEAYTACLQNSTDLGWFSEWSKLCERELGQIKPEQFPTATEIHADPNYVAPIAVPEPPQRLK